MARMSNKEIIQDYINVISANAGIRIQPRLEKTGDNKYRLFRQGTPITPAKSLPLLRAYIEGV